MEHSAAFQIPEARQLLNYVPESDFHHVISMSDLEMYAHFLTSSRIPPTPRRMPTIIELYQRAKEQLEALKALSC